MEIKRRGKKYTKHICPMIDSFAWNFQVLRVTNSLFSIPRTWCTVTNEKGRKQPREIIIFRTQILYVSTAVGHKIRSAETFGRDEFSWRCLSCGLPFICSRKSEQKRFIHRANCCGHASDACWIKCSHEKVMGKEITMRPFLSLTSNPGKFSQQLASIFVLEKLGGEFLTLPKVINACFIGLIFYFNGDMFPMFMHDKSVLILIWYS